ncbi:polyprenol monophosphomannose synthase [Candidatus Uhrbacteria bacterium]|nr:polyprenol monophosphomannose synthase [Candidatus Uhrbacteria bacterium]
MKTIFVIPTYNERDSLPRVAEAVLALPEKVDLLVVDDGSPDGTGGVADRLATGNPGRISVLHRPARAGLGSAYRDGFRWGLGRGYGAIGEMDADGSHDPSDIPHLLATVCGGADLAIGSRRVSGGRIVGWNARRHLMSWGAATATRLLLGLKTRDVTAGFRLYRSSLVSELLETGISANGYAFQEETLYLCERLGAKIAEVPVTFRDRKAGVSKLRWRDIAELTATIRRLKDNSGRH